MTELQILFQMELRFGKVLTLEQALEAMGRIITTREALEDEDGDYNEMELIGEIVDEVINEK